MSDTSLPPAPATRQLGAGGMTISPLAWGTWRLAENGRTARDAARLLHAALDAGITLVDTADIYGFDGNEGFGRVEELLGAAFAAEPGLRQRLVLATKGGIRSPQPYDQSAAYLRQAIDASLRRLQTDHVDLYQIHRPDLLAHPQEVARVLDDAVAAGKVRALGVSNFTLYQIAGLQAVLDQKLVATQPEISPLRIAPIENGQLDQAMQLGLVPLAWSPLAGGALVDPRGDRALAVSAALDAFANSRAISRSVAAYSWLMAHPAGVVPIIGSQNPARIAEAAQACAVSWTRQEWYAVLVAARGAPMP